MKRLFGGVLTFLMGAGLFISTAAMSTETVQATAKKWYDGLQVVNPYTTVSQTEDYIYIDDGEDTPTAQTGLSKGLKGATSLPSAYMNSLSALVAKYPSIRDQGSYNTCWAFSAAGLAEFDLITDNLAGDSTLDISEAQIAYFTYHNQVDLFGGTSGDSLTTLTNYLSFGGNLDYTARALLQWQGVIEESIMPYSSLSSAVRTYSTSEVYDQDIAHLQNAYIINIHTNQTAVKQEIINHGSAGIGLYMPVSQSETNQYESTAYYNGETVATLYVSKNSDPNHALNIVGWDDDFPASAFAKNPGADGAWLVRNSWSEKTENDINSYFWLSYYDKGIEDAAWIMDFESADNYDYNYQYDGCSAVYGFNSVVVGDNYSNLNVNKYANVFKVKGASNELIEAVSIALNEDTNVTYRVRVYTNLSDPSNPKSGILAASVKGSTTYAGTYTVKLPEALSVPKGTYFSVVVSTSTAGNGVDVEFSYDFSRTYYRIMLKSIAGISSNQSFIYYSGGWRDLSKISDVGNLCIKAYTEHADDSIEKTTGLKSSLVKKTSAKISWAKTAGASGYEVFRASSKDGTYLKVATVTSGRSYTNKSLKKNKTYYYKVRAYKLCGTTKIYGKLSSALKVKTKKK